MRYLKQSTTSWIQLGPYLDETDGITPETELSMPYTSVLISKGEGAVFAAKANTQAGSHDANGFYRTQVGTADTATLGTLLVSCNISGAVPVWQEYEVLPANVYDSLFGTDKLQVDMTQIDGQATNGNNATLNLKQLNIINNAGDAIHAESTGANGSGARFEGDNLGNGIEFVGGAQGVGLSIAGGSTSGNGINVTTTSGHGVNVDANGTTKHGMNITSDSNAIHAEVLSGNGNAIRLKGFGTGAALKADAGATGDALLITGGSTSGRGISVTTTGGHGIYVDANGALMNAVTLTSDNDAIYAKSNGGNGNALYLEGNGTGAAVDIAQNSTGDGIRVYSASGDGLSIETGGLAYNAVILKSTTGNAFEAYSTGGDAVFIHSDDGHGVNIDAAGTDKEALQLVAADGSGVRITSGGTHGMHISGGTSGNGVLIDASGVGNDGINIVSANANGIDITASAGAGVNVSAATAVGMTGTSAGVTVNTTGGPALSLSSSGANNVVTIDSTAAGYGGATVNVTSGTTGKGLEIVGGSTSGDAVSITTTDGDGISISVAGTLEHGIKIASAAGSGIQSISNSTNGYGLDLRGGGNGHGLFCKGGLTASGAYFAAGDTSGNGIAIVGSAASGDGVNISTTNGVGVSISGAGAGNAGLDISSAISAGVSISGSDDGVKISTTNGNAIEAISTNGVGLVVTGDLYGAQITANNALGRGLELTGVVNDIDAKEINDLTTNLATVDGVVDAILVDTGTTIPNTLGTPAGASISADIATIDTEVGNIQADVTAILVDTGTTIPNQIGTPFSTSISQDIANVGTNVDAILINTGTVIPATLATIEGKVDLVDSIVDNILFEVGVIDGNVDSILVDTGTTLDNHLTDIKGTGFIKDTDSLVDLSHQAGAKGTDNIHDDLVVVDTEVGNIQTDVTAILADTNELQTDWTDGGRLDLILDSVLVDTGTTIPADLTTIEGKVDAVQASVDGVSNVTRLSSSLPKYMERGAADKAILVKFALKDSAGNMEDPDGSQLAIKVYNSAGTSRDANLYKDAAMLTSLDAGTGTFVGYKKLESAGGTGMYQCYYKVAPAAAEEELVFEIGWEESAVALYEFKGTQVVDYANDLGALIATIGTPAGASVSADIAAVQSDATAILEDTGTTIPGILGTPNDLGTGATVFKNLEDMAGSTFDYTTDALEDIRDSVGGPGTGDATLANQATILSRIGVPSSDLATEIATIDTEVGNIQADVTAILVDTGTTLDNHLTDIKGTGFIKDTDSLVDLSHQAGAKGTDNIHDDLVVVDTEVGNIQTDVTAILADTNELQTDWVDGGRLDLILDAVLVDTGTTIPATLTTIEGKVDVIDTEVGAIQTDVTAILADTNELQTDWVDGGRLDLILDAILVDTGTTIPATLTTIDGKVDTLTTDVSTLDGKVVVIDGKVGTPVALDLGLATISGMLTKLADDNNGADFVASSDSQRAIAESIGAISVVVLANAETVTYGTIISGSYVSTHDIDGTYFQIEPVAVNGIDAVLTFDGGTGKVPNFVTINGYFENGGGDAGRLVELFAYNYETAAYDKLSTGTAATEMRHNTSNQVYTLPIGADYIDTVTGEIKIQFKTDGTGVSSTDDLFIDYIGVSVVPEGSLTVDAIAKATKAATVSRDYDGAIHIDTENGAPGSDIGINGLPSNPVDNLDDAHSLATDLGIRTFKMAAGSNLTGAKSLDHEYTNWTFCGANYRLDFNGKDVTNSSFEGANLSGTAVSTSGDPLVFNKCSFGVVSLPSFIAQQSHISGAITATGAGLYFIDHGSSAVAGAGSPVFNFVPNVQFNLRHYSGGIEIHSMDATCSMSQEGNGQLKIAADCSAGSVSLRGNFKVTDLGGTGNVTIVDEALYNKTVIDSVIKAVSDGTRDFELTMKLLNSWMDGRFTFDESTGLYEFYDYDNATVIYSTTVSKVGDVTTRTRISVS